MTQPKPDAQLPPHLQELFAAWRRSRGGQDTKDAWDAYLKARLIADDEA